MRAPAWEQSPWHQATHALPPRNTLLKTRTLFLFLLLQGLETLHRVSLQFLSGQSSIARDTLGTVPLLIAPEELETFGDPQLGLGSRGQGRSKGRTFFQKGPKCRMASPRALCTATGQPSLMVPIENPFPGTQECPSRQGKRPAS